jgi:lambda family phage portal protein
MSKQPNFVDRVIEYVAPEAAARRAIARQALASHRGGVQARTDRNWSESTSYIGGRSSDRYNAGSRRDRARRVYREHALGRSLLKTETDNVVGSGFKLQAKTSSKEFNREAEIRWEEWLDAADLRGLLTGSELQRKFYLSSRRDGDGGVVLVDRGGESRLQYIPGDLIATPDAIGDKQGMAHGVEIDAAGRPVGFHVKYEDEWGKRQFTRVSANNFVYLAPEIDDDMGVRGDSCYSQIFRELDEFDGYRESVTIAARMACVFGLVFKSETAGKQVAALGTLTNSQGNQQKAVTLENGSVKYIGAKDDVVQVQAQQPLQQTPDFIRTLCRIIGLPFDMPLELVAKDMSQVNFASARIGLIGYYRACRARQKQFSTRFMSRVYRWWISREVKMGRFVSAVPANNWMHKFVAEGWDYTDPVSEAQADLLQIDMGIKTPQMAAADRGRDWEEMQEERAAAMLFQKALNLPQIHSNLTRHPQLGVGAQGDPLGYEQAEQNAPQPQPQGNADE